MATSVPLRARTNAALLFVTFGLSQGLMLLAQTWLFFDGELAFIGRFGVSFSMATLGCYLIDWGGMVLLARHELANETKTPGDMLYWSLTTARQLLALVGTAALIVYALSIDDDFVVAYAFACAPILLLGAINPGGLIDGIGRSGLNGIASTLPSLVSAFGLLAVAKMSPATQGYILGGLFTLSTAAALVFQFWVLHRAGRLPRFVRPTYDSLRSALYDGAMLLMTSAPPLAFYRIELSASITLLGASTTGLFVYARQIIGAVMQGGQFIRRAEFPGLMAELQRGISLRASAWSQRASIGFIILGTGALTAIGLLGAIIAPAAFPVPPLFTLLYAVALLISALYASGIQVYVGISRIGAAAFITNLIVGISSLAMFPVTAAIGLYAFPIVEIFLNGASLVLLLVFLKRPASIDGQH